MIQKTEMEFYAHTKKSPTFEVRPPMQINFY